MKWIKKVATTPLEAIAKVVDTLQSQTNDRTNAPSIHAVREAINQNWLTIYPIGSIYMCVNDINPSEVFGGTWVQIKDQFLLAAGDIYNNGETGGEATHVLTSNELAIHWHRYDKASLAKSHVLTSDEIASHTHPIRQQTTSAHLDTSSTITHAVFTLDQSAAFTTESNNTQQNGHTHEIEYNGGGQTGAPSDNGYGDNGDCMGVGHNNMPPYLAVKVWKRTA